MKIAIKANPNRGKEIISLLESLGSTKTTLSGNGKLYTYYIDDNNVIRYDNAPKDYKVYTLEEFETQFPFKVGDLCIYSSDILGKDSVVKILGMTIENDCIMYEVGHKDIVAKHTYIYRKRETLKPYKEMKEERNITLTLEKAKEWYNKGEELREIALQAFTEKELNPLPRSWEEFCKDYPIKKDESYINSESKILSFTTKTARRDWNHICPSKKSAEAHLAMIQLEQLRDCYNNNSEAWGWSYSIIKRNGIPELVRGCDHDTFLRFNNETVAKEFLKNFRNLIEKAGDLI